LIHASIINESQETLFFVGVIHLFIKKKRKEKKALINDTKKILSSLTLWFLQPEVGLDFIIQRSSLNLNFFKTDHPGQPVGKCNVSVL